MFKWLWSFYLVTKYMQSVCVWSISLNATSYHLPLFALADIGGDQ